MEKTLENISYKEEPAKRSGLFSHWKMKLWIVSSAAFCLIMYFISYPEHSIGHFCAYLIIGIPISFLATALILGPIFGFAKIFGQVPDVIDESSEKLKDWLDR